MAIEYCGKPGIPGLHVSEENRDRQYGRESHSRESPRSFGFHHDGYTAIRPAHILNWTNMLPNIVVAGSLNMDFVVKVPRLPSPGETALGSEFRWCRVEKAQTKAAPSGGWGREP